MKYTITKGCWTLSANSYKKLEDEIKEIIYREHIKDRWFNNAKWEEWKLILDDYHNRFLIEWENYAINGYKGKIPKQAKCDIKSGLGWAYDFLWLFYKKYGYEQIELKFEEE